MSNHTNNPRKGRPSASGFEHYAACPGRFQLEQGQPDSTSAAASRGTLIHDWLENELNGMPTPELNPEDLDMALACKRDLGTVLNWVWPDWREYPPRIVTEQRLWYRRERYSGKSDVVADYDRHFLVLDYKTGPKPVPDAEDNWQLKALSALVMRHHKPRAITRAIVQPACGGPTIATADGTKEMDALRRQVLYVLRNLEKFNAPLRPGEGQCKYCKAKAVCPALMEQTQALTAIGPVAALTSAEMSDAMEKLAPVKALVKALEERAKLLLEADEECIPGWGLKKGACRRSVENPGEAITALYAEGIIDEKGGEADFIKVELGKLEKKVARERGLAPAASRALVAKVLGDHITTKEGNRQLCRAE